MKTTQEWIVEVCDQVKDLLLTKNKAYGDSALNPLRIFSKATLTEQLFVRIDDKLSRISRGKELDKVPEDTILDLVGYLILALIAERRKESSNGRDN